MWQKAFFGFFVMAVIAAVAYYIAFPAISQPASFNHSKHIKLNIPCVGCHNGALTEVHATLPKTEFCINCHSNSNGSFFEQIKSFVKQNGEVPWVRVTRLPSHVYFSHRRHTMLGQIKCQACHGPMENQTSALTKPLLPLTMTRCINCHRKVKAATDCDACHR